MKDSKKSSKSTRGKEKIRKEIEEHKSTMIPLLRQVSSIVDSLLWQSQGGSILGSHNHPERYQSKDQKYQICEKELAVIKFVQEELNQWVSDQDLYE